MFERKVVDTYEKGGEESGEELESMKSERIYAGPTEDGLTKDGEARDILSCVRKRRNQSSSTEKEEDV